MSKTTKTVHSELSISLTKSLDKKEKQDFGIFITPQTIIGKIVKEISDFASKQQLTIKTILEPACGTCEIVNYCDKYFPQITIDAVEFNDKVFSAIKPLEKTFKNKVTLIHQDFLTYRGAARGAARGSVPSTPGGSAPSTPINGETPEGSSAPTEKVTKRKSKKASAEASAAEASASCGGATPGATPTPYDLTISNPPYFVCKKESVPEQYKPYINGRPNIFGIFILHQLSLTRAGGIAAFIIPKSFLNSLYYAKIREHIKATCTIVNLIDFGEDNDFIDTKQETFGLILFKNGDTPSPPINMDTLKASCGGATPCPYSIKIGDQYIFTCDAAALKAIFEGSTTLSQIGLKVRTCNTVWNQNKELLTADPANNTVLLYDTNITKEHKIQLTTFKTEQKFQYIQKEGRNETIMVVKRGHGNSKYVLNYALIDMPANSPYLVENHLNEIYYAGSKKLSKKEVLALFNQVIKSFENKKTLEFIRLFIGNNGLSKTELETIFPIYL